MSETRIDLNNEHLKEFKSSFICLDGIVWPIIWLPSSLLSLCNVKSVHLLLDFFFITTVIGPVDVVDRDQEASNVKFQLRFTPS